MKIKKRAFLALGLTLAIISMTSCLDKPESEEELMKSINSITARVSVTAELKTPLKPVTQMNPLVSQRYSADPTSVEYNGRVYVYSTNDDQPYSYGEEKNDYGKISTLNVFSSDDMVNWTDHGYIDVKALAPWANTSWAPSIVKRVEDDGLTHFYLFYAANGWCTGVLTATSPLGPWTDPLGEAVIVPTDSKVKGIMKNCFDPGAVVDTDGTIYVACGAGHVSEPEPTGSAIVKLNDDLSIAEVHGLNAPFFFEANEMNIINGKYVYTYTSNWGDRKTPISIEGYTPSAIASMEYMIADNPMGPYEYKGWYFKNPGDMGFIGGNNHTHLQEFKGKWYLFYHARIIEEVNKPYVDFRNVLVDEITVNEDGTINPTTATREGVPQIKNLNPFDLNRAATICSQAGITTKVLIEGEDTVVTDIQEGDWILVKGVDFGDGASKFSAKIKGKGIVDIRIDELSSQTVGSIDFDTVDFTDITNNIDTITGVHDVYFVFGGNDWEFDSWQFS